MIFFYVEKLSRTSHTPVPIPVFNNPNSATSVTKLSPDRIQLISWNEITCTVNGRGFTVTNITELQNLVLETAKQDEVCKEINRRAFAQYGIYAFIPDRAIADERNSVNITEQIKRIFQEWAHPMIGNIVNSPVVRPQIMKDQYEKNWDHLNYIDQFTKQKIRILTGCNEHNEPMPQPAGKMEDLTRSSHDQARICPDVTTLARAVIGEITSIATRRIEKLFALNLCQSTKLLNAQKTLIRELLTHFPTDDKSLKKSFEALKLEYTEYIRYFFEGCDAEAIEVQWAFYVALIESALAQENIPGLERGVNHEHNITVGNIPEWLRQWRTFPHPIRCTVVLNSFRRFLMKSTHDALKLEDGDKRYSVVYDSAYYYRQAAGKKFYPSMKLTAKKRDILWSWNRDENHLSTQTYRKHLLPLWGGPSGHAHGNLSFIFQWLNKTRLQVEGASPEEMEISAVVLSSFFPFWRLYYDKRISAIHTIAETYEASISAAMVTPHQPTPAPLAWCQTSIPNAAANLDAIATVPAYKTDAFNIIIACQTQDHVINPIRLMNTLANEYYRPVTEGTAQSRFDALKQALDQKRAELTAAPYSYYIPLWSKPIVPGPQINDRLAATVEANTVLKLIKIFSLRNIKVFPPTTSDGVPRRFIPATANSSRDISELYQRLKQQGKTIRLNEDSLGSAVIPATWEKAILTNEITITNAILSDLLDNAFTITGSISVLNFGPFSIHSTVSNDASGGLKIGIKTDSTIKEFKFSDHYTDIPKTINGLDVLSSVTLMNLSAVEITDEGLFFTAEINTDGAFWDSAKFIAKLENSIKVDCRITAYQTPIMFSLCAAVNCRFPITENFAAALHSITLSSGLKSSDSIDPRFSFQCSIGKLIATITMNVGSRRLMIQGQFDGGTVLSLADIGNLFDLPSDIGFLPDDVSESVFGNLGLLEFTVIMNIGPIQVERIDFAVSAQKAWTILHDKITLKPCLCVSIEQPFDSQNRDIDLHIDGLWQLGATKFCTSISPFNGYLSAYMQEGETLDLTAAMQTFMGGLTLPQISIHKMQFFANYRNNIYEISLTAAECLEFAVCGVTAGIKDVDFYLLYENGAMGQFQLGGTLFLGGIALTLQGKYASENDWEFTAAGMTDLTVSLSELWNKLAADFPSLGNISAMIPGNFLSFTIGNVLASYSTKTKEIKINIALEKITITDSFIIDTVLSEVVIGSQKLEHLGIKAAFKIVGVSLLLEVSKESQGFSIHGGTQDGQSIAVGELLSDFVSDILKYPVTLPEALTSFAIRKIDFTYVSAGAKTSFGFDCAASFGGGDPVLANLFSAGAHVHITAVKNGSEWNYGFQIACEVEINHNQILSCKYNYDQTSPESHNAVSLKYHAKTKDDVITLADMLTKVGFQDIDGNWAFLTSIGILEAEMAYDFTRKRLTGLLKISSGGTLDVAVTFTSPLAYSIIVSSTAVLSLSDVPIVGSLTQKLLPSADHFSIKDLTFYALSNPNTKQDIPAGVRLNFTALGEQQKWQIYESKQSKNQLLESGPSAPKIFWLKPEKTVAIFTLHRLGFGLDGSYLMVVLDASLSVSPLTFCLYGAGIGVDISNFDLKFYISGFGVSFDNGILAISGEFNKNGNSYSGSMLIQAKQISIFAIAQYSEDGSLFAYAVVSARLGGPPAFFITGLALGFGYHKRLVAPDIDHVADFPLMKGAMGNINRDGMIAELQNYLLDEPGQKFLSFGIKFTTFEIAESFILLTVGFGNSFAVDLLGISDITMPPHCPSSVTPTAHAQLALKASFKPADGFLGIEARLTSESYILSKDCHLTGGFAFYLWFGGIHSGDFVITLGGYHPKYEIDKPSHYPAVPRVGFNWNIGDHVKINGDMYFALTPGALMAGGRLCATFTLSEFKAYFIAKMDFLISWKPFYYDIEVGITLGASYHINLWFVSKTIKVELGADLRIWGPDFSAKAHISIWIISFTMEFGANAPQEEPELKWAEFCDSFLPKAEPVQNAWLSSENDTSPQAAPIKISFGSGLNGQVDIDGREINSVRANGVAITLDTVVPITNAKLNGSPIPFIPVAVVVKPMKENGKNFHTDFIATVTAADGSADPFTGMVVTKNLPTALWGGSGEMRNTVPCGMLLHAHEPQINLFPEKQNISLDDLYVKGATVIKDAFRYMQPTGLPSYTDKGTVDIFGKTLNAADVSAQRMAYLRSLGVKVEEEISLEKYAAEAECYLEEEVLIPIL